MENASKALIFAGTILISLMVISALVFAYRDLTSVKRQETENQKVEEIAEFNKSFESYEKDLNGTQMFSLANKIADYNTKYVVNMNEGYERITLTVIVNGKRKDETYFSDLQSKVDKMMNEKYISSNNLEALKEAKENETNSDDKAKVKASKILKELENKLGAPRYHRAYYEVNNDWNTYNSYRELKNKKFKSNGVEYYSNGRIKSMSYTQN